MTPDEPLVEDKSLEASNRKPVFRLPILVLALVAIVLGTTARAQVGAETGQRPRETEVCLDCHDGYDVDLAISPHRVGLVGTEARVMCTDCHVGDVRH